MDSFLARYIHHYSIVMLGLMLEKIATTGITVRFSLNENTYFTTYYRTSGQVAGLKVESDLKFIWLFVAVRSAF